MSFKVRYRTMVATAAGSVLSLLLAPELGTTAIAVALGLSVVAGFIAIQRGNNSNSSFSGTVSDHPNEGKVRGQALRRSGRTSALIEAEEHEAVGPIAAR